MFLSSLGQTVFGTAIRTIGDDLHGLDQQAWVTTAYLITSTIATPIYGKLSDVFGRRPLYIFGIVVFILGAVLSSMSTSMLMLAGFRAVQGIGAGALMSLPLAIMGDILAPRERAKYQGYFLAVFGISSVIGPLIGGLLAGSSEILWITGWRWVLLINVPIGIAALVMVIVFLHLPKVHDKADKPRVDWWGATSVIVTLVPLLLVAEQGRTWGWGSPAAVACYVIGVARPRRPARHRVEDGRCRDHPARAVPFADVLDGDRHRLPGRVRDVRRHADHPAVPADRRRSEPDPVRLRHAAAGRWADDRVDHVRADRRPGRPLPGLPGDRHALVSMGYVVLTFMSIDKPLWFLMIGMFLIGLGLGSVMQSLTLASQGSVEARDMGVATSSATFFRQIGGTLGTAVLLSILFSVMPANILSATADKGTLSDGLDAALNPTVASAQRNQGVIDKIWKPITAPVQQQVAEGLADATTDAKQAADEAVTRQVTAAVQAQVAAGTVPAAAAQTVIDQQVAAATPAAEASALQTVASKAHATVQDGALVVDWSNAADRQYYVDQAVPSIVDTLQQQSSDSGSSASSTNDTSFLTGADARLTRPFMAGFNASSVTIYWVGLGVILLAFVLSWFFKVPPLRARSALQERADLSAEAQLEAEAGMAAAEAGSFTGPMTGSTPTVRR